MKLEYQYTETNAYHGFEGVSYTDVEVGNIFPNQIKEKLLDIEGTSELVNEFSSTITSTGFDETVLLDIFRLDDIFAEHKAWRIGEALAEFYLENELNARFYYNELRDARNPMSNKTGADLVGFIDSNGKTVFLFGEVKTSSEKKSPPQVLYSRKNKKGYVHKGMIEQLQDLALIIQKKEVLIRYTAFKVKNLPNGNPFRVDFEKSLNTYIISSKKKYHIFGVLVRDTEPTIKDIKARYKALVKGMEDETGLKMLALYVPIKMKHWNALIGQ